MKKLIFFILFFTFILCISITSGVSVYAEDGEDIQDEIAETVDSQLSDLDLSALEKVLQSLNEKEFSFFGSSSFKDKLTKIISGEFVQDNQTLLSAVFELVFDDILEIIPLIASIISVAIICSFISTLRSNTNGKSIADIIHFVCYGIIIILVINAVMQVISLTSSTLLSIKGQMEAIFPILLTLLTAVGGTVSVSVFQPAVALLSGTVMQIFNIVVMPIFIFTLIFSIISNLTTTVKLEKFSSFFSSLFKYILGFVFTIFLAFLSIQGITASSFDGVSIKAARYAIKSYVPIIGGYLSEGFDLILTSSVLIKNAVGAGGLILLFATVVVPLVKIIIFMFALKLVGAILEPLSDSRTSNFITSVSKTISMLVVMIVGVSFMYLITIGILMCSANLV